MKKLKKLTMLLLITSGMFCVYTPRGMWAAETNNDNDWVEVHNEADDTYYVERPGNEEHINHLPMECVENAADFAYSFAELVGHWGITLYEMDFELRCCGGPEEDYVPEEYISCMTLLMGVKDEKTLDNLNFSATELQALAVHLINMEDSLSDTFNPFPVTEDTIKIILKTREEIHNE